MPLLRRLLRAKTYALTLLLTLSLGLALSISMFAVVWGVAYAPLPYPDSERIVHLSAERSSSRARGGLTPREAWVDLPALESLEHVAAYSWGGVDWIESNKTTVLTINSVRANFFEVLGVPAQHGRTLQGSDAGSQRMVLSHATWTRLFQANPAIVGQTVKTGWIEAQVVGVMPPTFAFPDPEVALWIVADEAALRADPAVFDNARMLNAIGRLGADASTVALNTQLAARKGAGEDAWTLKAQTLLEAEVGARRPLLLALFVIAVLVLVVGCANAAHLVFVRSHERMRTLKVIQALGASPARTAFELFAETMVIAMLAMLLSVFIAAFALEHIGMLDSGLPRLDNIKLSWPVISFAMGATMVALLLAGLLPAWKLRDQAQILSSRQVGAPALGLLERLLPGLAIGLSLAAVAIAGAFALSANNMSKQPQLAEVEQILALQLWRNGEAPESDAAFFADSVRALEKTPGARRAALMSGAPFSSVGSLRLDVHTADAPERSHSIQTRSVLGPVMSMLGGRMVRGRALQDDDVQGAARVVVINERAAFEMFGTGDPIGRKIMVPPYGSGQMEPFEVIGVMENLISDRVDFKRPSAELWLSFAQYPVPFGAFLVETQATPMALARSAEAAIVSIDPGQAVYAIFPPRDNIRQQLALPRFFARNAGLFAMLALILAMTGIYGVLSVDLSRRRRELALRSALGASSHDLAGQVASASGRICVPGMAFGALLGIFAIQATSKLLIGIEGYGLWVILAASVPVLLLAIAVSALIARRAARTDPSLVLRSES